MAWDKVFAVLAALGAVCGEDMVAKSDMMVETCVTASPMPNYCESHRVRLPPFIGAKTMVVQFMVRYGTNKTIESIFDVPEHVNLHLLYVNGTEKNEVGIASRDTDGHLRYSGCHMGGIYMWEALRDDMGPNGPLPAPTNPPMGWMYRPSYQPDCMMLHDMMPVSTGMMSHDMTPMTSNAMMASHSMATPTVDAGTMMHDTTSSSMMPHDMPPMTTDTMMASHSMAPANVPVSSPVVDARAMAQDMMTTTTIMAHDMTTTTTMVAHDMTTTSMMAHDMTTTTTMVVHEMTTTSMMAHDMQPTMSKSMAGPMATSSSIMPYDTPPTDTMVPDQRAMLLSAAPMATDKSAVMVHDMEPTMSKVMPEATMDVVPAMMPHDTEPMGNHMAKPTPPSALSAEIPSVTSNMTPEVTPDVTPEMMPHDTEPMSKPMAPSVETPSTMSKMMPEVTPDVVPGMMPHDTEPMSNPMAEPTPLSPPSLEIPSIAPLQPPVISSAPMEMHDSMPPADFGADTMPSHDMPAILPPPVVPTVAATDTSMPAAEPPIAKPMTDTLADQLSKALLGGLGSLGDAKPISDEMAQPTPMSDEMAQPTPMPMASKEPMPPPVVDATSQSPDAEAAAVLSDLNQIANGVSLPSTPAPVVPSATPAAMPIDTQKLEAAIVSAEIDEILNEAGLGGSPMPKPTASEPAAAPTAPGDVADQIPLVSAEIEDILQAARFQPSVPKPVEAASMAPLQPTGNMQPEIPPSPVSPAQPMASDPAMMADDMPPTMGIVMSQVSQEAARTMMLHDMEPMSTSMATPVATEIMPDQRAVQLSAPPAMPTSTMPAPTPTPTEPPVTVTYTKLVETGTGDRAVVGGESEQRFLFRLLDHIREGRVDKVTAMIQARLILMPVLKPPEEAKKDMAELHELEREEEFKRKLAAETAATDPIINPMMLQHYTPRLPPTPTPQPPPPPPVAAEPTPTPMPAATTEQPPMPPAEPAMPKAMNDTSPEAMESHAPMEAAKQESAPAEESKSSVPIGAIVGASVGVALLLILVLLGVLLTYRKRRSRIEKLIEKSARPPSMPRINSGINTVNGDDVVLWKRGRLEMGSSHVNPEPMCTADVV